MITHTFDTKKLRSVSRVVDVLRKLDSEFQAQTLTVLLWVAMKPDISMRELATRTGLASSSVSRNVAALSKVHRLGKPGHDLVITNDDPLDRRNKLVRLTPKGATLLSSIFEDLEEGFDGDSKKGGKLPS